MSAAWTLALNNALVYQVYHRLSRVFILNHDQSMMTWEKKILYTFNVFSYLTNSFFLEGINQSEIEDSFQLASDWIKSAQKDVNNTFALLAVKLRTDWVLNIKLISQENKSSE